MGRKQFTVILLSAVLTLNSVTIVCAEKITTPIQGEMAPVYGQEANQEIRYYNQLTDTEKFVYDQLKGITPSSGVIAFSWPDDMSFIAASEEERDQKFEEIRSVLKVAVQNALDALLKDNPKLYWLDVQNSKYNWEYTGEQTSEGVRWSMKEIHYTVASIYSSEIIANTEQKINSVIVSGTSRYEKIKSIHDHLCSTVAYDYSLQLREAHSPYGVLANGIAVCEGYALTFKWLCDRENIPSVLVIGDSMAPGGGQVAHMWNYVQMEDGQWYGVDVTWDDQTDTQGIFYDYFLVGSETVASEAFGGQKFLEGHRESGDFSGAGYKSFSYPSLSLQKYDPSVVTPLQGISLFSDQELKTGETAWLEVSYLPENTTEDRTVLWQSSDPAIAAVSDGTVSGVSEGVAVITAQAGGFTAACTVTVKGGQEKPKRYRTPAQRKAWLHNMPVSAALGIDSLFLPRVEDWVPGFDKSLIFVLKD